MLEIKDLRFAYPHKPVLNGIDLDVERGELVALLGANGSGKSTMVKCLCGVLSPESGMLVRRAISRVRDNEPGRRRPAQHVNA